MMDYATYTTTKASDSEISTDKLLEAVKQFNEHLYEATEIFFVHPLDVIRIDMSDIPCNCYFICHYGIDKGKLYKVEDGELKRELYEFIERHPDRAFRGKKYN